MLDFFPDDNSQTPPAEAQTFPSSDRPRANLGDDRGDRGRMTILFLCWFIVNFDQMTDKKISVSLIARSRDIIHSVE